MGTCAQGEQLCDAQGGWSACSIVPSSVDTCALGNDDDCDGNINEDCACLEGAERPCGDAGWVGPCLAGKQTCSELGSWSDCSVEPALEDTCVEGNNDDCLNEPNEGCLCIENVTTQTCGACNDSTQVCVNGKTNQYGACTGGSGKFYYEDKDGDGYGSDVAVAVCGDDLPPSGFVDVPGDCCDDGGNLTLAAQIRPNQTTFFKPAANICGITWDYNCSGELETTPAMHNAGCAPESVFPNCVQAKAVVSPTLCGKNVGWQACVQSSQSGGICTGAGQGVPVNCH